MIERIESEIIEIAEITPEIIKKIMIPEIVAEVEVSKGMKEIKALMKNLPKLKQELPPPPRQKTDLNHTQQSSANKGIEVLVQHFSNTNKVMHHCPHLRRS